MRSKANQIVADVLGYGAREVIKVKSLTTDEIRMNEALSKLGVTAIETDLLS
jgi:L-lactate dehydrogenase complex protein LldF